MTNLDFSDHRQDTPIPVVQWEFERDRRHLMCEISMSAPHSYEVAVIPLWEGTDSAVETFDEVRDAFNHHAALVSALRDSGWTLSAYTARA